MVNTTAILGADQRALLCATERYDRTWSVDLLFQAWASHTPDAIAVKTDAGALTYRALNQRIHDIAAALAADGVNPGDHVALMLPRGNDLIAAQFAVMRLGAAYAPIDIAAPPARREETLALLEPRAILKPGSAQLSTPAGNDWRLPAPVNGADVAAIMFTSGSTGAPKGVRVRHRGIVRLVRGQDFARFTPDTCFLFAAPPAFDAAHLEIYAALLNGGAVAVIPEDQPSLDDIAAALAQYAVTDLWLTAGLFHLAVDERPAMFANLRRVFMGGDVVSPHHLRKAQQHAPETIFINGYGPTENTTFTTCFVAPQSGWGEGPTPIGVALRGDRVMIDGDLEGELLVAGDGVAAGYLGADEHRRFRPDPDDPSAYIYATGDIVRRRGDGALDFLGRRDRQIKIAGRRIEVGAIEALLRAAPGVRDAAVLVDADPNGEKHLIAVCTPAAIDLPALHAVLDRHCSPSERPQQIYCVNQFPLTTAGKLDRAALLTQARKSPLPDPGHHGADPRIAAAFSAVLEHFDARRSFAENAISSLQMLRIHARLARDFPDLPLVALYDCADMTALAQRVAASPEPRNDVQARAAAAAQAQAAARARRVRHGGGE
jgi:amino acid adenylation domain-containing protein